MDEVSPSILPPQATTNEPHDERGHGRAFAWDDDLVHPWPAPRETIAARAVARRDGRPMLPRHVQGTALLANENDWKRRAEWVDGAEGGYFRLETADTGEVPVRLFVTPKLLGEAEPTLYRQVVNATRFPGVKLVCVTPDVHYGYGVPVGCVILTDCHEGSVAMGPWASTSDAE